MTVIISWQFERARNVGINPEFITLMYSGFILIFRACSDHRELMKICLLRVLS